MMMDDDGVLCAREILRINALGGNLPAGEHDDGPGFDGWPDEDVVMAADRIIKARESS